MTLIDWANWSNSASTTGQSKGWPGALVVAVEAGDMKRQQLSHRNSLPVLLVAVAGRLLPSVDAFPGAPGQATRVYHAGTAGHGPARKKPGRRPADPARLDPATAGKRRRNNPAAPGPKYWGRGKLPVLCRFCSWPGGLPRR